MRVDDVVHIRRPAVIGRDSRFETILTVRFFLVNRELASLVLDHLDHKAIGTFRLVCKAAVVCARSAFLRTSTKAHLSEFSLTYAVQDSIVSTTDERVWEYGDENGWCYGY